MAKGTTWELAPHTSVKHDLLRSYLSAWFPILGKYNKRVVFLDGFAGPGAYDNGEPGSPLIALCAFLDHGYAANMSATEVIFVFNEQHKARHASLSALVAEEEAKRSGWPPNVKVLVENKNFRCVAEEILGSLDGKSLAPTFAFVDPFGYKDMPMELISRLTSFSKSELFIYYDINSLNRFATAGNVDRALVELFDSEDFKLAPASGRSRQQYLHDLYERQLRQKCKFKYVQSFEMVGPNNKAINYMFFCTNSLLGLDKMKSVMWKAAPAGDYRFVDRFNDSVVLFEVEPDTSILAESLLKEFSGSSAPVDTLEEFVTASTPFVKSHLRRTLKKLQDSGKIDASNQRRYGTFPPGTQIDFPGPRKGRSQVPTSGPVFT